MHRFRWWLGTEDDKPLSDPMMTQFTDAYIHATPRINELTRREMSLDPSGITWLVGSLTAPSANMARNSEKLCKMLKIEVNIFVGSSYILLHYRTPPTKPDCVVVIEVKLWWTGQIGSAISAISGKPLLESTLYLTTFTLRLRCIPFCRMTFIYCLLISLLITRYFLGSFWPLFFVFRSIRLLHWKPLLWSTSQVASSWDAGLMNSYIPASSIAATNSTHIPVLFFISMFSHQTCDVMITSVIRRNVVLTYQWCFHYVTCPLSLS